MEKISLLPEQVELFGFHLSQTLVASLIGTALFLLFSLLYFFLKKKRPDNTFVNIVDMLIEGMTDFYAEIAGEKIPLKIVSLVIFVFFYVLRSNLVGLMGDMFALVLPNFHHVFRPVSTDIMFNLTLAAACVVGSIIYGFSSHGRRHLEHYFPVRGVGIVPKVTGPVTAFFKIFDIIIGLFVGLIEIIGEFSRMLSLSLRLLGNILAGMILLTLITSLAMTLFKIPVVLPLLVFAFELFVSFLQAFVFSLLTLVYLKLARETNH